MFNYVLTSFNTNLYVAVTNALNILEDTKLVLKPRPAFIKPCLRLRMKVII